MKDDSLSDVVFCNTKEGMHITAKKLNIKAYNLGCSCHDCNKGFDKMIDSSVGKQESPLYQKMREAHEAMEAVCVSMEKEKQENAKQIWNDAIEAAAYKAWDLGNNNIALEIRRLKK